ncbi:DExH-box ATP-dependent RNA helicase DExH5, mitochondrial-like isoform X1 [Arachis stenosperma]|uniref:DExH-box ATP-dependent RNA helicase DExH5, mitochondrial-like isoform X1 n=1 Tax=Arachis stenosperma TaxID=217475 RepID=UPI0025AC8C74|nr:DExH-box ATP-dependent RNA helicase DExH5, mitochondrial-like isoform X1 [Arachis stenosperma]
MPSQPEEASSRPSASLANDIAVEWKQKLITLLDDESKQELISREKKDRREFQQIAALASKMGLYSHVYAKVVVISKVPLPNYRPDLDDRRPLREVSIPISMLRRVDAYLEEYQTQKSRMKETFPDLSFARSTNNDSIGVDERLFEKPQLPALNKAALEKILRQRSLQMRDQQQAWQESAEGRRMLEFRRSLPAYKEKEAILSTILRNQVVIISGQTGCGKTTQLPQFILECEIESLQGAACNIICTQPRRISAISVSERVALERGEKLGESVGYKVRLEGIKGRDTRLLFCTTGILLRRLIADRKLKDVTHIIVDEIHERGMNEDFLLIVLKDLLPRRPEMKLILMSATLDAELFSSYFNGAAIIKIPGFTHPVRTCFLEDILELSGYRLTPDNQIDDYGQERIWKMNKQAPRKRKSQIASVVEDSLREADFKDYNPQTRESLSCWNPDCMGFNFIEYILCHICEDERPGAVLVFMIGWDDISALKEKLLLHPVLGDQSRVLLLICHGSMASSEQRLIFEEPEGVRKIVLATNIAETSITINDIVFVLDCGKEKESSYDALNNTPCLLPTWISKVSAQQRRGRAGRVQPGECYHLYPRCVYDAFAEYQLPEILRTPLQSLCLQIKSLKLGPISEFLSRALQSPEILAVQNAIEYLKIIGAFDDNENLTLLGHYLTMFPMEPKLGKMLILGAIFNCLDPILTVTASLSVRDPFLAPLDQKDVAAAAKSQFSHDYSDHLALVRAYDGWKDAEIDLAGQEYCWANFLSSQSMKAIDALRMEFLSLLKDIGIVDSNATNCNAWSYDVHLIRAVIFYGLYPGICSIVHKEKSFSLKTMEDGKVHLHLNSVNARESKIPYPWLVFNEKIKVNSVFLRDSTAVSDSVVLLFGGKISNDGDGQLKMLGGYLEFLMKPPVAEMFQSIRRKLDDIIQSKLQFPMMGIHLFHELLSAVRLLISEDKCKGRFVFSCQVIKPSKPSVMTLQPALVSRTDSGPGGDNSKGQLQTLLARAGCAAPIYKTMQIQNNQFRAAVEFNGIQIMGQPCHNKKTAEKDAAAEALQWLMGKRQAENEHMDHNAVKKSKRDHN